MRFRRPAVILPTVLFVLLLLGLLVAMYSFRVNADLASMQAVAYRAQARLAAEAGVDYVKLGLREYRLDVNRWYNNPEELNRVLVWSSDTDPREWGTTREFNDDRSVYRFSIVADDPTDDEDYIRFGLTDESARLNLNEATEEQLLILVRSAAADDTEIDPQRIVDAILDWRDADSDPHGEDVDTEGDYYRKLDRPYLVKNGPFDTVEELLLVKGMTAKLLYGEDFDRNGLLTPNEDDGDLTFPPDNEDNVLNRGMYPYLTVLSKEDNVANDNRQRIYLYMPSEQLRDELDAVFPEEPEIVDYIVGALKPTQGGGAGGGGEGGPGGGGGEGGAGSDMPPQEPKGGGGTRPENEKSVQSGKFAQENPGDGQPGGGEGGSGGDGSAGGIPDTGGDQEGGGDAGGGGSGGGGGGSGGGGSGSQTRLKTPAGLLRPQEVDGQFVPSPLGPEHLAALLDKTTVVDPQQQDSIPGLINVNTAPPIVLRCLTDLTEEQVQAIVSTRASLSSEAKATPAWLLTEGIVDLDVFEKIAPKITARGQQFTIESLGFADHIGMVVRLQAVVEVVGPIARTIYYRDLTELGGQYPIREEDKERLRGR